MINCSPHTKQHRTTTTCSCSNSACISSSGSGSCEKVVRWVVAEGRSLGGALQFWNCFENIGANLCNLVHSEDNRSSKVG